MIKTLLVAAACTVLAGCGASKEEQCLQSKRIKFNDPDSLQVVENLGARGQGNLSESPDFFWLRYKATNAYGAYVSGNMACARKGDKWVRDEQRELDAAKDILLERMAKNAPVTFAEAESIVLTGTGLLP